MHFWPVLLAIFLLMTQSVFAQENNSAEKSGAYSRAKNLISETLDKGKTEVYIPFFVWHNRDCYPKKKIDGYNETPIGLGIGKSKLDYKQNRDSVMFMAFTDSNYHIQPILGYSWQKIWRDKKDLFRFSLGYVAGFTTRKEWYWFPIPMALPIVGFDVGNFSVETTYVPGLGPDNGNVFFSWAKFRF